MGRVVWFGDGDLRQGGVKSYMRGLGYVDKVEDLKELPDGVVTTVYGTRSSPYEVRLSNVAGVLAGDCSCPWGTEGQLLQALCGGRVGDAGRRSGTLPGGTTSAAARGRRWPRSTARTAPASPAQLSYSPS